MEAGRLRAPDRSLGAGRPGGVRLEAPAPVNVLGFPRAPADAEFAELGVARISYAHLLHHEAMAQFSRLLGSLHSARAEE